MVRPKDVIGVEMLTIEEIAEMFGVSKKWVQLKCNKKKTSKPMPYRRVGRRYWFIRREVCEWNDKRRGA